MVLSSRTHRDLDNLAAELEYNESKHLVVPADISEERQVEKLFGTIQKEIGRLDILINNAGIGIFSPLVDFSVSDFYKVIDTNLKGTFLCCRHAMRIMIPQQSGYIINISSVVGFKGYPNQAIYTASKHGIMGLTKSLAAEAHESGVRVSAVLPGGVDTDMAAEARPDLDRESLLRPEDIAKTVIFLLSLSDNAAIDQIFIRRKSSSPF